MKTSVAFVASILISSITLIGAKEKSWTSDMDYNTDRRESPSDPYNAPWDFSSDAQRAEYSMLYLLQSDKDAITLARELDSKVSEGTLTHAQMVRLRQVSGNLGDVVRCAYADVTPFFTTHENPTLLLMMLYHFEVYRGGGDADEGWPAIIEPLQKLDPAVTAKAKEMAIEGRLQLNKMKKPNKSEMTTPRKPSD